MWLACTAEECMVSTGFFAYLLAGKNRLTLSFSCLVLSEHLIPFVSHKWMHQFICNPILSTLGTAYLAIFYLQAWCILWNMKFVTLLCLFWNKFSNWTAMVGHLTKSWKCWGATNCAVQCIETLTCAKTFFFELAANPCQKRVRSTLLKRCP